LNHQSLSAFIWSVADLLRGDYKQSDYGKVILPFTVLRRLDCVLEPTKAAVLAELKEKQKAGLNPEPFLLRRAGQSFYNTSQLDLRKLIGDQDNVRAQLSAYVQGFSANVRDIFERFEFAVQIDRLAALSRYREILGDRSSPEGCRQRPDGPRLRGADPQVRRTLERDGGRAFHPARGHPADGQPDLRRGRRGFDQTRRRADDL